MIRKCIAYILLATMILDHSMISYAMQDGVGSGQTELVYEMDETEEMSTQETADGNKESESVFEVESERMTKVAFEGTSELATESVTEELSEDVTESATEELSKDATESATEELSEDVTESATEELSEDATESETEEVSQVGSESATEEALEETTETEQEETMEETTQTVSEIDDDNIRYIYGRPMTEEEIAAQYAMIPDNLQPIPMDGHEEFLNNATNNVVDTHSMNMLTSTELPTVYDLRTKEVLTPVKHQGTWGTCWAFSIMAVLESSWKKQFNETLDLSEWHLAYFTSNTGEDELGNASEDTIITDDESKYLTMGGNVYRAAVRLMNWHGAAAEADYPYPGSTVPEAIPAENGQEVEVYAKNIYFIPYDDTDEQENRVNLIKNVIMEYGCIEWSYYHSNSSSYYNASTGAYYIPSASTTNHSITVVGWDDTYSKENFNSTNRPSNDGAWIIKNSWGKYFGDSGYIYISYEDASLGCGNEPAVLIAGDASVYDYNYFHGNTTYINGSYNSRKFGEVFVVDGEAAKQTVKGVSFRTNSYGISYSIQLYKNPELVNGVVENPESGEALYAEPVTGYMQYPGMYTVDMPKVNLAVGDYVSVVISSVGGGNINLAYDRTGWSYGTDYTNVTAPGQSFKHSGYNWEDWEDLHEDGISIRMNLLTADSDELVLNTAVTGTIEEPNSFDEPMKCNLIWNKCSKVKNYEIYRSEQQSTGYSLIGTVDATSRTYQDSISVEKSGTRFYYKVKVLFQDGTTTESEVFTIDADAKLDVDAEYKQYTEKMIILWQTMGGATGYQIQRKDEGNENFVLIADINDATATEYVDNGFEQGVSQYRIRAYNAKGEYSDWSQVYSTTDQVTVTKVSATKINIEYEQVDTAKYYRILLETDSEVEEIYPGGTTYGLNISDYEIGDEIAITVSGYKTRSNQYDGVNAVIEYPTIYYMIVPDEISNVKGSCEDGIVSYSWDAVSGLDYIQVYRSMNPNNRGELPYATIEGTAVTYTDDTFTKEGTYYYWFVPVVMKASGQLIQGNAMANAIVVASEPVEMTEIMVESDTSARITWKAYKGADYYMVYRSAGTEDQYECIYTITDPSNTSFVDENMVVGTTYFYKVTAIRKGLETALDLMSSLSIQLLPATPELVEARITSVSIESHPNYEYAIGISRLAAKTLEYQQGTGELIVFDGLKDASKYYIFARTKRKLTGEEPVCSIPLEVKTKAAEGAEIVLSANYLKKDEGVAVTAMLKSGEITDCYDGTIIWTATNQNNKMLTVSTQNDITTITGTDKKDILTINHREMIAVAESMDKAITLTGTLKTVSGKKLTAVFEVTISVPATGVEITCVAVNGDEKAVNADLKTGDTLLLKAIPVPENADTDALVWSAVNTGMVTIATEQGAPLEATVKINKAGKTKIKAAFAQSAVNAYFDIESKVKPVEMVQANREGDNAVQILWEAYEDADSYKIYRKTASAEKYTLIKTIQDSSAVYGVDDTVVTGRTYFYKVTAVNNGLEALLDETDAVRIQVKPGNITLLDDQTTYESITIKARTSYEYAIGLPKEDKFTLDYVRPTGSTLTFRDLEADTEYVIYVRTSENVTGEASVYGPVLQATTMIKAELLLSVEDVVLTKGNSVPFTYTIKPNNLHYADEIVWSADDGNGTKFTVTAISGGDGVAVKDAGGLEIIRVVNGAIHATGLSAKKEVYLHISKGAMDATCHVVVNVPVSELTLQGVQALESLKLGNAANLTLVKAPTNADMTKIYWESSNEQVVTVEDGLVTAIGVGCCEVKAYTEDGVSISATVQVVPSETIVGIWLSENIQLKTSEISVYKDEVTGEYVAKGLEQLPMYELSQKGATMTVAAYVAKQTNVISLVKATSEVSYQSSNSAVVTVSEAGVITAVGAGEADIYAYDTKGNGICGSCKVIVGGDKAVVQAPDGYPIDKAIKLSAVKASFQIESYANDPESCCVLQIKDKENTIYKASMFTFTSANPDICMVDTEGVVRPNPSYEGKDASVKITATLKSDKAKRKVTFTVKVLTTKQVNSIDVLQVDGVSEREVSSLVQPFAKAKQTIFYVRAYDSRGTQIKSPKLKVTLSDTSVAAVKTNAKDGSITVTWKKAGRTNLIVMGNDAFKRSVEVCLAAVDTKPYVSKTQLTVNTKKESVKYAGVDYKVSDSFKVTTTEGSLLKNLEVVTLAAGKLQIPSASYELVANGDESYCLAIEHSYAKNIKPNTNLNMTLKAVVSNSVIGVSSVDEMISMKLKVTAVEPKITVKEAKTINRFMVDGNETLLIISAPDIIEAVTIVDNSNNLYDDYFEVKELYRGQWYLKLNNELGEYRKNSTDITLALTTKGYEPVLKKLKVATPEKKPSISQLNVPTIHYGDGQQGMASIGLYNKTAKAALTNFDASFTSAKLIQGTVNGGELQVSLKKGVAYKNGETVSAKVELTSADWNGTINTIIKVKVQSKTPKLVTKASTLTLNSKAQKETAATVLSVDRQNIVMNPATKWEYGVYNKSKKTYETASWLTLDYDPMTGRMSVGIKEGAKVAKGSYKIRISNVLSDFEAVSKEITVKVIESAPKVTVTMKGKLDLINRENSVLTGTLKYTNTISSKVAKVEVLLADQSTVNPLFVTKVLSDKSFSLKLTQEGMEYSFAKKKHTYPVRITMENGTTIISTLSFTPSQATPKVKTPVIQTVYKSGNSLVKDYDLVGSLTDGVKVSEIKIVSVPKGISARVKDGSVILTLNNRGIKAGTYSVKVEISFAGAAKGTKPVTQVVKLKVAE